MRISRPLDFTYKGHLQNLYYVNDSIDQQEMHQLLTRFRELGATLSHVPPVLFVIDYMHSRYLVMTESSRLITSYDPRDFLEGGIPMLLEIFHRDDFRIYNECIFPANVSFLKTQSFAEHSKFIFSYNFRVKHKSGRYLPVLQRGCYITSPETGLPLYSLGMVIDISLFKKDRLVYHNIEKMEEDNGYTVRHTLAENCFYPYEEDRRLSPQETRILQYMAEGLSSKQIADKLKISENTIANHRKNMLKKTSTKNVAELVALACRSGLI
ncbi:helix-turn-helix transcriptional regulator [Compostibacter hankyongensis]|uniref:HTH luxR-type domain-containing protein n=1 Tax=Compostibacter hankyongensis TaxID=1007089 RepID=A0ABP8G3J5_9BACT